MVRQLSDEVHLGKRTIRSWMDQEVVDKIVFYHKGRLKVIKLNITEYGEISTDIDRESRKCTKKEFERLILLEAI